MVKEDIQARVILKYEELYGSLPIRLVEDPTDRMLHEGDVIKFIGSEWHELTGFWKVTRSVQFGYRKATYNFNGVLYPLILAPGQVIQLQMDELIPINKDTIQQYRVGIPDNILLYVAYPQAQLRFAFDKPEYRVLPKVDDDRAYIGAFTSADSPFDAPRLELANVYSQENNVYLYVKNDSPTYQKVILNIIVNKLKIEKTKETEKYMPFYSPEVIP